ncbi:MAG: NAD(P)/FAD-dependent oxidoreductase [Dehalococcoidia bacterium]|nr:NAD(P)/FAD-dependent oxidoreductase [Dehalococcoidia bacterium]
MGAGPVGSYLAYKLAGYGYQVIVLEQRAAVGEEVCCTGIIGRECFDRFPVANNAVLTGVRSINVFSPLGKLLKLRREEPLAYIVDRADFDRALAHRAMEEGAEYRTLAKVKDIAPGDESVAALVELNGQDDRIEGKIAVICNGFGSVFPKKLGMGKIGDFVTGAQTEVGINGLNEVEVYLGQNIAPGFFAWLVPISSDRALVGLLTRKKPPFYLKKLVSELTAIGKIISSGNEFIYRGIPLMPLPKSYARRLLVAGDAAGHVKPTTGGGIYYGLLCADIAAKTVHEAMSTGDLSAKSLSHYEMEWKKVLAKELQIGYLARRLYENLSDKQIEHIFGLIDANDIHNEMLRSPDFSFDWHAETIVRALKHKILGKTITSITKSRFP